MKAPGIDVQGRNPMVVEGGLPRQATRQHIRVGNSYGLRSPCTLDRLAADRTPNLLSHLRALDHAVSPLFSATLWRPNAPPIEHIFLRKTPLKFPRQSP